MNFSYLAIKLPNFKSVDEKLPEWEPRVSHSFVIKIVSRKKLLKVLAPPQTYFRWNFVFQNLAVCMRYHNNFFAILKLYFWSNHMAKNLILAISFGFKLNSNLKLDEQSLKFRQCHIRQCSQYSLFRKYNYSWTPVARIAKGNWNYFELSGFRIMGFLDKKTRNAWFK